MPQLMKPRVLGLLNTIIVEKNMGYSEDQEMINKIDIHNLSEKQLLQAITTCYRNAGLCDNAAKGQMLIAERMRK